MTTETVRTFSFNLSGDEIRVISDAYNTLREFGSILKARDIREMMNTETGEVIMFDRVVEAYSMLRSMLDTDMTKCEISMAGTSDYWDFVK